MWASCKKSQQQPGYPGQQVRLGLGEPLGCWGMLTTAQPFCRRLVEQDALGADWGRRGHQPLSPSVILSSPHPQKKPTNPAHWTSRLQVAAQAPRHRGPLNNTYKTQLRHTGTTAPLPPSPVTTLHVLHAPVKVHDVGQAGRGTRLTLGLQAVRCREQGLAARSLCVPRTAKGAARAVCGAGVVARG